MDTIPRQAANIDSEVPAAALANANRCDPLDPSECLYPFPNNDFTVPDKTSATGLRIHFAAASMPRSSLLLDVPVNPAEWNRNDGFSPGSAILVHVEGIDLKASKMPDIGDIPRSLQADSPIVLVDTTTLKWQACWAELDVHAKNPAQQALIIHPARALLDGHRYVVALRDLRNAQGQLIPAPAYFRIFRDNHQSSLASVSARRAHMEAIFKTLASAGVARSNLYLAWDFTVASEQDLTGRLVHIRDDAFKSLGSAAPSFSVTRVTNYTKAQNAKVMRVIDGNLTVPSYLTLPDPDGTLHPVTGALDGLLGDSSSASLLGTLLSVVQNAQDELTQLIPAGGGPIPVSDLTTSNLSSLLSIAGDQDLPLARFYYATNTATHPDALPSRLADVTLGAPFECIVPRSVVGPNGQVDPARISLYGHGLFGSRTEVTAGNVETMAEDHDFVFCAVNWMGFSDGDIPNALLTLMDISFAPSFFDIQQQGVLNFLWLARAMKDPQAFAANPAFQVGSPGESALDTSQVYYVGNSQGGIMGGTVLAVSLDVRRAVLGVTGANYANLLLQRSTDFARYSPVLYAAYPNPLDQQLVLGLLQMLWDRADPDGYLEYMTRPSLPNTPTHKLLMQTAWGDHQVSMYSAQYEARSVGAFLHCPVIGSGAGRPEISFPYYGLPCIPESAAGFDGAAAMSVWDDGPEGANGVTPPPLTNTAPSTGHDPHGDPRATAAAQEQQSDFLRPGGTVIDTCGGKPCGALGYEAPPPFISPSATPVPVQASSVASPP
ncbi:MAG TPA: hypothetical protein VFQ88_14685 [Nevskiaceae bacterium]|nr:hypothetical protein [Nevskiaceae bacterium]